MKQNRLTSIPRWRDGVVADPTTGAHTTADEQRAVELTRAVLAPGVVPLGLSQAQLERIERTVRTASWSSRWSSWRPTLVLGLVLVGLVLVVGVASGMAYQAGWLLPPRLDRAQPRDPPKPVKPKHRQRRASAGPAAPVAPTADEPEPAAASEEPASPENAAPPAPSGVDIGEPVRARRPSRPAGHAPEPAAPEVPPASPPVSQTAEEIAALDSAVVLLRGKHDARGALEALDDYLARFPTGVLSREARFVRVDALLMLDRQADALAALEALPLDAHRRSTELQLIRAELRARLDCRRAEHDFTQVLDRVRSLALEERALYGRGACRVRMGQTEQAVADLRRYLARFPKGAHAMWAQQWIESKALEVRRP